MEDLIKQMQQDSGTTAQDNMGKIGAVANDVADTDKEIADLEKSQALLKAQQKHFVELAKLAKKAVKAPVKKKVATKKTTTKHD